MANSQPLDIEAPKGGLGFSLRTDRPLVIDTPVGSIEIRAIPKAKARNSRSVKLMVPSGCFAHMGERDPIDGAQV